MIFRGGGGWGGGGGGVRGFWTELTNYLLGANLSSADNLCKQFGPESGRTKYGAWS